ncbi:hypothetical protein LuPra_03222 [Luteitalea pratensis]|uniref:DUF4333 domain-containing protein n=1 Tax=Luteitalea pratensis TaxID=1855912 RepID=A0A143PN16_LUTPR|nr:DUF4333 domain-containing protein [Luteitalea pratensis]AMY09995.1 hypothetical protein LuPra_03222 [Luteitalea pratensis]
MLALAALVGCTKNLNVDAVAPAITQGVSDQVGLRLASVTCPSGPRPLVANDTFNCTGAVVGGGSLTIAVTQTDDTGNITWKVASTDGLLDLAKVEGSIVTGLRTQAHVEAKVSCGGKWKAAGKGDKFDCQATAPDGTPIPIGVTVADGNGNVSWETK